MGLIWVIAAAVWGVAEATVFFIVPDVLLTYVAVRFGLRRALALSLVTAIIASFAGGAMWWWGASDPGAARDAMLAVPAIHADLLVKAHAGMAASDWPWQLVLGALTGTPYKLYAVEAGALGIDPYLFVALSIPARMVRFVITAALAAAGNALFQKFGIQRWRCHVLAFAWIALYGVYWTMRALA